MPKIYVQTDSDRVIIRESPNPFAGSTALDDPGFSVMGQTLRGTSRTARPSVSLQSRLLARIGGNYTVLQDSIHDWWETELQTAADKTRSRTSIAATRTWAIHITAGAINFVKGDAGSLDDAGKLALVQNHEDICRGFGEVWYRVMLGDETNRDLWTGRSASVAIGAVLYSDIYETDGTARTVDGSFLPAGGRLPDNNLASPS